MAKRKQPSKSSPATPAVKSRPEAVDGYHFEQARADRVATFLETFVTMSKGRQWAGKPMKLMPWQRHDIIEPLFGWVDDGGLRRYRRAWIEVAKKNGKSSLMAGLVLYFLLADGEPGANVYGAAVDRIQAGLIYRDVAAAIRRSPQLSAVCEVIDSRNTIVHKASGSRYQCLAADSWRAEGIDASAVIVDELHAHRSRALVDALMWAGAARSQPITIAISTAGYDRTSIAWQFHRDAELVMADPKANPTFFGKIYAASKDDDPSLPATWAKANPSLGVTLSEKDFAADYLDATTNPSKFSSWQRYRLNVWNEPDNRWFSKDAWEAVQDPPPVPLAGRDCFIGIDLASTLDITAAAFVYPAPDGTFDVEVKFWIPEDTAAERARKDRIPYLEWIDQGWVTATDGSRCDYERVVADIVEHAQTRRVISAGIDMWNAGSTATQLQRAGIEVEAISQSIGSLTSPCKLLESLVAGRKIRFNANPVMTWMAHNVVVFEDSSKNIKADKKRSQEKIDGIVATVLGLALASTSETAETTWKIEQI